MECQKKILVDKYIIQEKIGSGGEGYAYLVKEKDTERILVAKILKKIDEDEDEEDEDEKNEKNNKLNKKFDIFNTIRSINPPNPYIIGCILAGNGTITKDKEIIKTRNYFIVEFAPKGDLYKYVKYAQGFKENHTKVIFQKILMGVQALHESGIYHLDLKLENIVLDNDFNPKICDFGLATNEKGKLIDNIGTKGYKAPQIVELSGYSGEKADIFSLGCILFNLITGTIAFENAESNNAVYKYIITKKIDKFFEKIDNILNRTESLSPAFKELYPRMIAYEEKDRPKNIKEILEDKWFNDLKDVKKKKELEDEVKKIFLEKEKKVNEILGDNPYDLQESDYYSSSTDRGLDEEINEYFPSELVPKNKKVILEINNHFKIKGKLNYNKFMNTLVTKIQNEYENNESENCNIEESKKSYKCDLIFEGDNNDKCTIQLKLYKSGDNEFILRFLRKAGELSEYYAKLDKIIYLVKKLL